MELAEYTWVNLDAKTFQPQLRSLAETLSLKVQREGPEIIPTPRFLSMDLHALLKQASHTFDLFFYLSADEKRHKEAGWRMAYGIVTLPLIRCMIDCLYNVTAILDNPARAFDFRKSGYMKALKRLDEDDKRFGGNPQWDAHIAEMRRFYEQMFTKDGFTAQEIREARTWPTLGRYLQPKKNTTLTAHQILLKELTFGFWDQYSSMAHGTLDGLMSTALFYMEMDVPHDDRPKVEESYERTLFMHMTRMAGILLSMLTEVQAYFKFDGANINRRLHEVWNALRIAPEVKDLYDSRYKTLMQEKNITPD